ncbi:MAG: RAMP superfamily CRISPR-associated protein [Candidatus Caldarchaeum sp.]
MSSKHPYLDFDQLKSITIITGTLVNHSPLRIGVGGEPPLGSSVDAAVLRLKHHRGVIPYIPGSSLKGIFRTFVEQSARSKGVNVHPPWNPPNIEIDKQNPQPCDVCGIFGNTRVASHVRVYDALPSSNPKSFVKTGVSIDREFGGQRPRLLYTEEFVPPMVEWCFRMDVINIGFPANEKIDDNRVEMLGTLFETLKQQGLQVGARRSVGAGLFNLRELSWIKYSPRNGFLEKVGDGNL